MYIAVLKLFTEAWAAFSPSMYWRSYQLKQMEIKASINYVYYDRYGKHSIYCESMCNVVYIKVINTVSISGTLELSILTLGLNKLQFKLEYT